jgi:hypothetical protein
MSIFALYAKYQTVKRLAMLSTFLVFDFGDPAVAFKAL